MNTIISFGLCPFVQRSLITMNYKNVPYDVKYIDLADKPEWFLKLSPLGKVPILQVEDVVLFESAVINEYVDEVNGDSLHSRDPLVKAKERAFIELSSSAIMNYFQAAIATEREVYEEKKLQLEKNLSSLLAEFKGPFFRGSEFSLVDTSVIPLIQRIALTGDLAKNLKLSEENSKKLISWSKNTLAMEEVKKSVPENFENDYKTYLKEKNSYVFSL
ncbi:hypothetical protein A9Q84_00590 [Halobacteriovorax marinus]|uniref:Glutathione S-transferase n=1 Tax=Halobacteriovorax marinus TaxID=97084 RepID=A0A1Y5FC08_9BACT|nr:hypothetical protein A9Q84_00590 [Halobacteriovorax marinus]